MIWVMSSDKICLKVNDVIHDNETVFVFILNISTRIYFSIFVISKC